MKFVFCSLIYEYNHCTNLVLGFVYSQIAICDVTQRYAKQSIRRLKQAYKQVGAELCQAQGNLILINIIKIINLIFLRADLRSP